ncbi:MAG: sugar ABC transporter permease, partial [Clostridiales bacterium]|nr:sugar ABC transporter permease [Clostridiales bacterium]
VFPTAAILIILNAGSIMSVGFEKIYLMQNDLNLRVSEVISTYVYKIGLTGMTDFSLSTAIGLFNSAINMVMLLMVNGITRKLSGTGLF